MENYQRWRRMTPEERAHAREQLRQQMTPEQRQRLRQQMTPAERQHLRQLTPEQRQQQRRERRGEEKLHNGIAWKPHGNLGPVAPAAPILTADGNARPTLCYNLSGCRMLR